eukprot:scaffold168262_cov17-Tisochrysis_lutea.AAC.1
MATNTFALKPLGVTQLWGNCASWMKGSGARGGTALFLFPASQAWGMRRHLLTGACSVAVLVLPPMPLHPL